ILGSGGVGWRSHGSRSTGTRPGTGSLALGQYPQEWLPGSRKTAPAIRGPYARSCCIGWVSSPPCPPSGPTGSRDPFPLPSLPVPHNQRTALGSWGPIAFPGDSWAGPQLPVQYPAHGGFWNPLNCWVGVGLTVCWIAVPPPSDLLPGVNGEGCHLVAVHVTERQGHVAPGAGRAGGWLHWLGSGHRMTSRI